MTRTVAFKTVQYSKETDIFCKIVVSQSVVQPLSRS